MAPLGQGTRTNLVRHPIENYFPRLRVGDYQITSPESEAYNCIAWAAGQSDLWWEPDPFDLYFWPPEAPRNLTLGAYVKAFGVLGYVPSQNSDLEPGFEKVAIYTDLMGKPTHAARQLPSGNWTSKLGELEDIEHETLDCLSGSSYGSVALLLKRPIQQQTS